jgi:uncharacterized protein (TIGR00369 family)
MELIDNNRCFVCGKDNEHGLHAIFEHVTGSLRTKFITLEWMQGYAGIIHGGIITTLLDECMVKLLYLEGMKAVTAELQVKLLHPVTPGSTLCVSSQIAASKNNIIKTTAQAELADGTIVARASATCVIVE